MKKVDLIRVCAEIKSLALIEVPCEDCATGQTNWPIHVFPDMPLIQVEPQRLYRQIAKQLQGLISSGEFAIGSRMPAERDLATQLGVSRPSVREALIALEVEGVIEVRTGSGIYVKSLSKRAAPMSAHANTPKDWGPLEVLSARVLVEAEVASLAATHATSADLKSIGKALRTMYKEVKQGRPPVEGDVAFHLAVAQASANSVLLDTVDRYGQARSGPLFTRLGDYFESPASWAAALSEHEEVLAAIAAHDPQIARKAMQKHLKQAHKRFSASWRSAPSRQ